MQERGYKMGMSSPIKLLSLPDLVVLPDGY